ALCAFAGATWRSPAQPARAGCHRFVSKEPLRSSIRIFEGCSSHALPGIWSATTANAMPAGSTCALDVIRGEAFPFRSWQCVVFSRLVTSQFAASACAMNCAGTDHSCGTGAGSPGQCIYGPCTKAGNQVFSMHDPPPGNPNCSVG